MHAAHPLRLTFFAHVLMAGCADGPHDRPKYLDGDTADTETSADTGTADTGTADTGSTDTGPVDTDTAEDSDTHTEPAPDLDMELETEADAKLLGAGLEDEHSLPTLSLSATGDLDGDGRADLVLGFGDDNGTAFIVSGPVYGTVDLGLADTWLNGIDGERAGTSVSAGGDVDGDGLDDLVVGAPYYERRGAVYVVPGPVSGRHSLASQATAVLVGEDQESDWGDFPKAGENIASGGDLNGDGIGDLVIGATGYYAVGSAYVIYGPVAGAIELGAPPVVRVMGELHMGIGREIAFAGDTNGDGRDDLLFGTPARLFTSPIEGDAVASDADAWFVDSSGDGAGKALAAAGDVDADGYDDILLGDIYAGTDQAGAAWLLRGPFEGERSTALAEATLLGVSPDDRAGIGLCGAGDTNSDGFADVAVAAAEWGSGTSGPGAVYLVLGPVSGTRSLADSHAVLHGDGTDWAGYPVTGGGDVDGDGLGDLLIGGPGDAEAGENVGAAWLMYGASLD